MATTSALEGYPSMRELIEPAPLFRTTSLSDEIVIHRMKLDLLGRNLVMASPEALQAVAGLTQVDRLDVCDPRDEAAHGYSFRSALGTLRLNGAARVGTSPDGTTLVDAGRAILGGESFRVHTPQRERELVLGCGRRPTPRPTCCARAARGRSASSSRRAASWFGSAATWPRERPSGPAARGTRSWCGSTATWCAARPPSCPERPLCGLPVLVLPASPGAGRPPVRG